MAGLVTIRITTPADISALSQVHVRCWREAYRGIIPAEFLGKMNAAGWAKMWEKTFKEGIAGEPAFERYLIAEDSRAGIIGFAAAGPSRDKQLKYDAEIYSVYVLSEFQGRGTGRELVSAAAGFLLKRRMKSMVLWVLEGNTKARGFYERLGGLALKLKKDVKIGGEDLVEIPYAWEDLGALQARLIRG